MISLKRLVTDAAIISLIVLFSYVIYLSGEIGYLTAFGVADPSSFITLEPQNIIFGFLKAVFYFINALIIFILAAMPLIIKNKNNFIESNAYRVFTVLMVSMIFILTFPLVEDRTGTVIASVILSFTILFAVLSTVVKIPGIGMTYFDIAVRLVKASEPIHEKGVILSNHPGRHALVIAGVLSIIIMPIINYVVSYNSVSIYERNYEAKVTKFNGADYVVARQYADKVVLVKLNEKLHITPEYLVLRGAGIDKVAYSSKLILLDNDPLFLKSQKVVDLSEFIKGRLKIIR